MNLRGLREAAKLTQDEVAALTGLNQTTISQLELGRARDPRHSTLRALASAYGCTPDDVANALAESILEAA